MTEEEREPEIAGPSQDEKPCGDTGSRICAESEPERCNQSELLPGMLPLGPRPDLAKGKRELARRLGVSHAAVIRAEKSGRITALADGIYDVPACREAWERNTKRTRPSAITDPEAVTPPPATGTPAPLLPASPRGRERVDVSPEATEAVVELLREHGVTLQGDPSRRDAATAREIIRVLRDQVALDRDRGQVVDRMKAHTALATFTRTVRNALLAWPRAVAPTIASELGLLDHHPLELAIENHLRLELDSLSHVPPPDELLPPPVQP